MPCQTTSVSSRPRIFGFWRERSILKIDAEDYLTSPAVAGMGQPMAEAEMQREALRQFEVGGHEHLVRLAVRRLWLVKAAKIHVVLDAEPDRLRHLTHPTHGRGENCAATAEREF